jgi:serine/threonine protein phosphatase PrpC
MTWIVPWTQRRRPRPIGPALAPPWVSLLSDSGCRRELNEDSARVVDAGRGPHGDRGVLIVVADGMGGHQAGEVASQTAVETIELEYRQARGAPGEALERAFRRANRQIYQLARRNRAMNGMGATCTALALVGREAWAAHVGDSRLYLIRGDAIYQLTEDQTQCMEMVRRGLMSRDAAARCEDRNVLTHAMGTKPELTLISWREPTSVLPGDAFVLCSDGLHELVAGDEIRDVVRGRTPQAACAQLVALARERGGPDNITVAVARIPDGDAPPASVKATRDFEVHS